MWGLGQRPNCWSGDHFKGIRQQRRRQRSVPASNFALPQERPPSRSFQHLCCVAPDGRDRIACLPDIACLSRKQEIFAMQYCTLEKRGLSGDILRARNAVGEGRHPRGRKRRRARRQGFAALRAENRHERAVPRRGVYAAVRGWKITRSNAASAGENDDDGSKIPKGLQPCLCGQLDEAG